MFKTFAAIGLCALVLLIASGISLMQVYQRADSGQLLIRIDQTQRLLIFGKQTIAMYTNTDKKLHQKGDSYSYTVSGKTYEAKTEVDTVPQSATFLVYFLPENPAVHSEDPDNRLALAKKQYVKSNTLPLPSILIFVAGLGGIIYSVIKLITLKKLKPDQY